ncbi:CrcB family protein [Planosporangium mesophilum]|nr:CrcB family protein [Planosporangium mesophilum]NJC81946.1 CrcB family protein [Planosporangium mesophilum]
MVGTYHVAVPDTPADTGSAPPAGAVSPFPAGLGRRARVPWAVLGVISVGGAAGALARYGLGQLVPASGTGFPWVTFAVNVSGCLLIGVLTALVSDVWPGRRLLRPFLGTGLLGGYTTFSTYVVEIQRLIGAGSVGVALTYLAGTLLAAIAAVHAGITGTRALVRRARRAGRSREAR